jgi:hypothetical protein
MRFLAPTIAALDALQTAKLQSNQRVLTKQIAGS